MSNFDNSLCAALLSDDSDQQHGGNPSLPADADEQNPTCAALHRRKRALCSCPLQRSACCSGNSPAVPPYAFADCRHPGTFCRPWLLRSRQIPAFIALHREGLLPAGVRDWFALLDHQDILTREERSYAAAQLIASFRVRPGQVRALAL